MEDGRSRDGDNSAKDVPKAKAEKYKLEAKVRLYGNEARGIERLAEEAGLSVSPWLRNLAQDSVRLREARTSELVALLLRLRPRRREIADAMARADIHD